MLLYIWQNVDFDQMTPIQSFNTMRFDEAKMNSPARMCILFEALELSAIPGAVRKVA